VRAHESAETVDAAWAEAVAELRWVDFVFSRWRPESAVSREGSWWTGTVSDDWWPDPPHRRGATPPHAGSLSA
jgi:hypothetical protein